jgi:hydroxymethylpyrimidine/phosphomethylpyrimidine kinase
VTALTAQSTRGVDGILAVPPDFVTLQIAAVAEDLRIAAVKTGMLNDRDTVRAVADAVRRHDLHPLVVDPVMVATSGDLLLEESAIAALRGALIPLADLLTPNLDEAARLLECGVAIDEAQMAAQARALLALGCKAVVVKGGHGTGAEAADIFLEAEGEPVRLALPRIESSDTHGTGCTFSAAITAYLALGAPLRTAVPAAKRFVHEALQAAAGRAIGRGCGPVDHLYALPNKPERGG